MVVNASTWEGLWMPIDPSSAYDELKMHYKKECRFGVMVRLGVMVGLLVMVGLGVMVRLGLAYM